MKYLFTLVIIFSIKTYGQSPQQKPCSAPEASQFDFWVGDWIATWGDTLQATNHIVKILGNCTLHENFSDPQRNFFGQSWSVYNPNNKQWQQTWVDSQGGYIALTGGMAGDSVVLKSAERTVPATISPTGKMVSRMVYYNITPNSFAWRWEASTDGGKTWQTNWLINYKRKT